jgi:hypothetical protein
MRETEGANDEAHCVGVAVPLATRQGRHADRSGLAKSFDMPREDATLDAHSIQGSSYYRQMTAKALEQTAVVGDVQAEIAVVDPTI